MQLGLIKLKEKLQDWDERKVYIQAGFRKVPNGVVRKGALCC